VWSGFSHIGIPPGLALVGSYANVVARIREYNALGIDLFFLAGYPHLEEAYRLGEHVLPHFRGERQALSRPVQATAQLRAAGVLAMNPNHYSRRQFIGQGLAVGGGLLLGTSLLRGCGPDDAPAPAAWVAQPRHGGRLRLGILDGGQPGNLDAHKPIGSGIVRGFALYSKLWEWDEQMQPRLALAEFAEA